MSKIKLHRNRKPKFSPHVSLNKSITRLTSLRMSKSEILNVLECPIKSEADKKLYKTIRLANGLTALLISDPSHVTVDQEDISESESSNDSETDSDGTQSANSAGSRSDDFGSRKRSNFDEEKLAACALTVNVGSYSDPPDIQGLAHFVEHMVFMGSEKYPKENEFDSFVKKKGGSDNAATDCELTTFYFEVPEKHLPVAMDMFSQFFVSPLMNKEAMQREREAIESEFAIAAPSDANRKDQLLCSLFPEGHPARIFTWGNLKSLRDDINDDEKLYRAGHEFRKRHYSAHRMTVAVQARMDLPQLEQYVVNTFSQIPTNDLPQDDFSMFSYQSNSSTTPEFNGIYYVKPISETTELNLTWLMRSLISEYESKPHQYVSYLLGHEGKGSLLSYLRKKVWALGIFTGNSESGIDYTTMYSLFSVQVVLTKDGFEHIDEVVSAIFSYLQMLKYLGPSESIFDEIKIIEETSFRFDEEAQPADYVENLVENMQLYPPKHYITGDRLYYKYDPEGIMSFLNEMTADKVNIMILSNKHTKAIKYDSKEKWFGTEYKRMEIPNKWMKHWLNATPYKEFHLPNENIYITTDFTILPPAEPYEVEAQRLDIDLQMYSARELTKRIEQAGYGPMEFKHGDLTTTVNNFRLDQPNLIRKNKQVELWYKPDFKFRFPTALLYIYFITPLSLRSPKESCLLDLWHDVVHQGLKEEVYPANMADLSHSLYIADKGFTVKLSGYNQNLHLLLDLIAREMTVSTDNLTRSMFEAVRDVRARIYHNVLIKPQKLAKDVRMNLLLEPYISARDKAQVLQNITLKDLKDFNSRLFHKLYLQMLVQGNLHWADALQMSNNVLKTIGTMALSESEIPSLKVHKIPVGEKKIRVLSLNKHSTNSIVTNYYQGEVATPQDTAALEILTMLMEEPVFDMLRTKEQLGYSVYCMMRYTFGVLGLTITVNAQVDKFSVQHVDNRVDAFLKKFVSDLRKLNEKTLASTKQSLIQLKHTTDFELKEEVERNWREIVSREYMFLRLLDEAEAISELKLSEVKSYAENNFPSGSRQQFKKLSVQVQGNVNTDNISQDNNVTSGYTLNYLDATTSREKPEDPAAFILDLKSFKRELPLFDVLEIELPQC